MTILIIALLIVVIGIIIYLYNDLVNVDIVKFEYDEKSEIMTVASKSKTKRLFTDKYTGSCTVWYHLPEYKRCNVFEEKILSGLYRRWKHSRNTK